jgi:hypothetical protein
MHFSDKIPDTAGQLAQGPPDRADAAVVRRRRFPRWARWLFWPLLALLLLLALAAAGLGVRHKLAVDRLAEATAETDALDPGWRLEDIEAARAQVPDETNGILALRATAKLLPKGWPPPEADLPKAHENGAANLRLGDDERRRLRAALEAVGPARTAARKLAAYPTGRANVVYLVNFPGILIPHTDDMRAVTHLLVLDALLHAEEGDLHESAFLCRTAFNAARAVGDEPISISQLIRGKCANLAGKAVVRLMAQGEPDEADLAALQRVVEEEAAHPGLRLGYRGDRALIDRLLRAMADGDVSLDNLDRPPTWGERCRTFYGRDALRREHAAALPLLNKLVEVGDAPLHRRPQLLQEHRAMVAALPHGPAKVLGGMLDRVESPFTRNEVFLTCLAVALAAERYRRAHGDWPPSLEALAPQFLGAASLDPFDAEPLRYARLTDGVAIYSLCPDAKGGVFDPEEPPPVEGVGVRLWDADRRGAAD